MNSMLGCTGTFRKHPIDNLDISSVISRILRLLCIIGFETYQRAFVMKRKILEDTLCVIFVSYGFVG